MERESYNIDDILSEVKKRREEQERSLREENKNTEEKQQKAAQPVKNVTEKQETKQPEIRKDTEKTPAKNAEKVKDTAVEKEKPKDSLKIQEKSKENKSKEIDDKESDIELKDKEINHNDESGMINILNFTAEDIQTEPEEEKVKFFKTKKGKIVKVVIIVLVLLIVAAGVFAAIYINNMLNKVVDDDTQEEPYEAVTYYDGMDFLQEDFPLIEEQSAYEVYSYRQYLKDWYKNGDPVRSSHVLNVLLIGQDTREENISDASRADSAIIASINIDTGTIHLTSILRDLYVYYEINGEGRYGKINESAGEGGIKTYIETLQRVYKVAIDGYAIVNFASFPKIIDALGGVEINITNAEINEINNNPYRYGDAGPVSITKTFEGNEGVMKLDGLQALAYCRIRKIDSDNARADRQKAVLTELLNKTKSAGTLDTVKVVNQLSQFVKTSYNKKQIIAIGNTALRDGWLNYEMQTANVPLEENCAGGEYFSASPNNWIWIADIPKDAYELQTRIYGKSNIKLNENRADYIALGR